MMAAFTLELNSKGTYDALSSRHWGYRAFLFSSINKAEANKILSFSTLFLPFFLFFSISILSLLSASVLSLHPPSDTY